ncbi:MAG: aspartyl/asparaginyl beta-hydroxylase domain-containing protein [Pseudomonadota bacterium]
MDRNTRKAIKRVFIAVPVLCFALVLIPRITLFLIACGLIDVGRNKGKTRLMYRRYFMGNGIPTWLLSPFNLLVDLFSKRNPGLHTLDDFPADYRSEIETVLSTFKERKDEIIADIDAEMGDSKRGMYVYRWYGKRQIQNIDALNGDFKYLKTIAVSVFSGKESTTWHYGPLRLSYRILYNLTPVETDKIYIECNGKKHYWHEEPLYIFDDTLFHRSVNELDSLRYCVFMDIARPSRFPGVIDFLLNFVSAVADRVKSVFYKNWRMIGVGQKATSAGS